MSERLRSPSTYTLLAAAGSLCLALLAPAWPAHAQHAKEASTRKKLEQIRTDIQQLNAHRKDTSAKREALQAKLAAQAKTLSSAAAAVHESDQALAAKQAQLDQLEQQRSQLEAHLSGQKQALAALLRAAYALGRGSDLRLLLGDENINRMSRALAYSRYFQEHRVERIRDLTQSLTQLSQVRQQIESEQQALQATRDERAKRMHQLANQRAEQRKLLAQVDAQYQSQGDKLKTLKENEKNLDRLLEKLRQAMARAREQARHHQAPSKTHGGSSGPPSNFKPMPEGTPFAKLRGHLPWPVHGARSDSGDGVLIAAPRGTQVHAVAPGQVIYANWLRGYGMLVIIDQGHGWLSLYGNNEAVLVHVGDRVHTGTAISTSGATSGREGVYFELRHGKRPVDTSPWLAH
ncbi:peptidoglycan DD-metalloendopeptidase family protein [Oleiagrimonas sp. C23AA]|uniref:murein hydrolase activator EnvC family protein n=1 Tax=Oleiagrimonas sp. C23AA TaxID=2719047 RepID=UPI00141EE9A6|nr:peptidoglycan DD-metalloendopeptidase family protein [Oleiagrimonas sp. C23AA]NII12208.1 peptidoglycan DD-metalloendopeptidase family protein [Oleiagrimonas sp. C23AA]